MPASGSCRLRSTSAPSALSGETYSTRTPFARFVQASDAAAFSRMSASMANRNAASVLPEPVGAMTSASSPSAMASHARSCTGVGPSANASRNHPRTASEKRSRAAWAAASFAASMGRAPFATSPVYTTATPPLRPPPSAERRRNPRYCGARSVEPQNHGSEFRCYKLGNIGGSTIVKKFRNSRDQGFLREGIKLRLENARPAADVDQFVATGGCKGSHVLQIMMFHVKHSCFTPRSQAHSSLHPKKFGYGATRMHRLPRLPHSPR
ncbi:hypothetical protein BN3658_01840 [Coriobacteriaceae bacterium CHKCI002]|nr:hypothetical protein BN3658_01840 [Coriobacteriaceae bacterium CHKCI002]